MSEQKKCKLKNCQQDAEVRPRYEGYCCLEHRNYADYEKEIEDLQSRVLKLELEIRFRSIQ